MSPGEKLEARRFNERVKLFANYANTLGVAVLAGAVIVPAVNQQTPGAPVHWLWVPASLVLHIAGLIELQFLKPEE